MDHLLVSHVESSHDSSAGFVSTQRSDRNRSQCQVAQQHGHRIPEGHLVINGTRLDVEVIKFAAVFTSSHCASDHDTNGVGTGPLVSSTASLALCKALDRMEPNTSSAGRGSVNETSSPPWHSIVGRGKPLVPASAPPAPGLGLRSESTPPSLAASQTPLNLAWELIGHSPASFTLAPVTAPFPCAAESLRVSPKREDTANETAWHRIWRGRV